MITFRHFQAGDAEGISELFREVYADGYPYTDMYVPMLIEWHNSQRHWHSVVAVKNDCIVGHAALWRRNNAPCAELALFVTHPGMRRRGVATRLGMFLCCEARNQQLSTLTIKTVCSHPYSQKMAENLGFCTTALLREYVTSPFEPEIRESLVLGVLALQSRPVPLLAKMNDQYRWLALLSTHFGTIQASSPVQTTPPLNIIDMGDRIEVTIHQLTHQVIDELARFPRRRRIYLSIPINYALADALPVLYQAGYQELGLVPDDKGGWLWLLQRGFRRQYLHLYCPIARMLQAHQRCDS